MLSSGNPLGCVPCRGPLACLLVTLCLRVSDGCSEAVMRFGFGPWVCPGPGLYDGDGGGRLGGGGGSPMAPFHPTASVALNTASGGIGLALFIPIS